MSKLDSKPQIWKLAVDLGLGSTGTPVSDIVRFAKTRVRNVAHKFGSSSLGALLDATSAEVGTSFEEIHSDKDLLNLQSKYYNLGEKVFANLDNELNAQGYAITLKRQNPAKWDRPYISIIDCRGEKSARTYFSKWHELAHLLTLTQQMRIVFRRTHGTAAIDAEEALMDIIAGEVGFLADFVPSQDIGEFSFEAIEAIRQQISPGASYQSASIGIVKASPRPCILIEARLAVRKCEERNHEQLRLPISGHPKPTPVLRAVHVTVNEAAHQMGIYLPKNWRVPTQSVISSVFETGGSGRAEENLNWWRTTTGGRLPNNPVKVQARRVRDSAIALLIPQGEEDN